MKCLKKWNKIWIIELMNLDQKLQGRIQQKKQSDPRKDLSYKHENFLNQ